MDREEVARNQRARLYGAMIESIDQRGYRATTVAHVISLAGVSRRAFYELFANKEECFLGTYDIVVASARKRMLEAWSRERGWANRVHAACKTLLDDAAESPKGPHLVLVDALGIGPKSRERLQLAGFTFERLVTTAFKAAPQEVGFPQLTPRAVVGGVRHVVFIRLLEKREKELFMLTDEVLDWIESYRTPAAGGGVALLQASAAVSIGENGASADGSGDERTGARIVLRALEEPLRQLAENADLEGSVVVNDVRKAKKGHGLNASTNEIVDLVAAGVIDPAMVTRSALQNAALIAKNILTTEAIVAEVPEKESTGAGLFAAAMGEGPRRACQALANL